MHVASLGEFEQGRPIIEKIRLEHPRYKILLTFFSPSGYEIRKDYPGADYIFYLPIDTPRNARRFLDIVRPEIAIFVKYEFWINLLTGLRRRGIRTYIVSAIFRRNSVFFRQWGGLWRQALETFDTLFVQNEESRILLGKLGFDNVVVAGDTRFDRVAQIAANAKRIELVERFRGGERLFVAGSTWGPDEELLIELMNANPGIKFVVAPHEMDESRIARLIGETRGGAVRYTRCTDSTVLDDKQLLILDTVGILASVYGYATWAYIGGGFGVGIHNTLEAATFGLPVAFGPNYAKFKEARRPGHAGCGPVGEFLRGAADVVHSPARQSRISAQNQPRGEGLHHAPPGCHRHRRPHDFRLRGIDALPSVTRFGACVPPGTSEERPKMPFRFGIFSTGHSSHRLFPASVLLPSRSFSRLIFLPTRTFFSRSFSRFCPF